MKSVLNLFTSPGHLVKLANEMQIHVKDAIKALNTADSLNLDGMLEVLDDISDRMCVITDSSECIRRLHPDRRWKRAAEEAFGSVCSLINELNSDRRLAEQFSSLASGHKEGSDAEKDAVIQSFKRDFELFAVLSEKEGSSLNKLQNAVERASMEFESLKTIESLEKMIRLRFELAKALGFKTPLELGLRDKQLKTFDQTMQFLKSRWDSSRTINDNTTRRFKSTTMTRITSLLALLSKDLFNLDVQVLPSRNFNSELSFKFKIFDLSDSSRLLGTVLFEFTDPHPTHYTIKCRKSGSSGLFLISVRVKDFERVSFTESQAIFHEFGHALHSVLSETKYQVLSGTRGPVDLAEVPSTLFELFHDSEEIQRDLSSDTDFIVVDNENIRKEEAFQFQIAVLDQLLHHHEPSKVFWSRDLAQEVEKEFKMSNKSRDWFCSLTHLATYGGNYFAYPFSKSVAERVYANVKAHGGSLFKREFLVKGGIAQIDFLK